MTQEYKQVGYRILKADEKEYLEIKNWITRDLGSDMCFIQWNLLRAFYSGMKKTKDFQDPVIELKFLRQHIQLNIGCQINYNRIKARRLPNPRAPEIKTDREFKLPLLLEDWDLLSEKSKQFWLKAMKEKGIIKDPAPPISTGPLEPIRRFFRKVHSRVKQLLTKWA